jgi:hypothetical protein
MVMSMQTPTHAPIETWGTSRCSTCATPPYIPPTCTIVSSTMTAQTHTSQFTRSRGPGTRFRPSSPVCPVAIVYRPSSPCTTGLIAQLTRMIQSAANPTCAPSVVVAISSPDPTIEAASTIPGPIRRSALPSDGGGASIASGVRM